MNDTNHRLGYLYRNAMTRAAESILCSIVGVSAFKESGASRVETSEWVYGFYVITQGLRRKDEEAFIFHMKRICPSVTILIRRKTKFVERHLAISFNTPR